MERKVRLKQKKLKVKKKEEEKERVFSRMIEIIVSITAIASTINTIVQIKWYREYRREMRK